LDWIGDIDLKLRERLIGRYLALPLPKRPFPPRPDPCLTCPPPDLFEAAILGGIVRAASEAIHGDRPGIENSIKRLEELNPNELNEQLLKGAAKGLKELQGMYLRSLEETKELLSR
jgi:hypothetical protein